MEKKLYKLIEGLPFGLSLPKSFNNVLVHSAKTNISYSPYSIRYVNGVVKVVGENNNYRYDLDFSDLTDDSKKLLCDTIKNKYIWSSKCSENKDFEHKSSKLFDNKEDAFNSMKLHAINLSTSLFDYNKLDDNTFEAAIQMYCTKTKIISVYKGNRINYEIMKII